MKIKFLLRMMILSLLFATGGGNLFAQNQNVDYEISTKQALIEFAENVNAGNNYEGKVVVLTADITLTNEWTPIGNGSRSSKTYTGNSFKGVFDGNNKTINGLTITSTTGNDAAVGLFGIVDGGTVKNLNLTDVNIDVASSDLAGAAIGMMLNGATADKITVSGAVIGNDGVGGIVGRLIIDGTISNCINNASVTSSYGGIGGIVGKAYHEDGANTSTFASVTECTNNGTVTAPMYIGGIAGLARANVTGCTNNGAVVGGTQTGGIIGQLIAAGTVSANENTAIISGTDHLGGIIGDYTQSNAYTYYNVSIANNINRGEVSATQCAAIMGCNNIDGFTAMTATGNLSYYWHEGLELFATPYDMVIDNTNRFVTEFTVSTKDELQAVLDNCRPGTTILLNPAEYGVVYMRPNPANAATKEVDWQGNNYRYETYSCFENLTIKGVNNTRSAEAAVIDAIVIEGGTYYNTAHSQATEYPIMLSLIELKNVVIEDVTFTGEGGYDPQGYGNAINLGGNNIKANGLTVKNCVFNNAENNARLMYKTEITTTEHNYTYNGESFTFVPSLYDITVEGCTFNGGYMGLELRETENLVISGNTFNNVTSRDILLPVNTDCTYTGEVDIIGNTSDGAGNRFLRASGIGNATLTVKNNTVVNYRGEDADFIKADGIAEGNTPVIENNTLDGEDVAVVLNNGTVMVVLPVAQIGETKYGTLQAAIDAVQNGETIELLSDVTENVTVTQKPDVNFTIDGAQQTMTGAITVDGKSATIMSAGVTIKNVKFNANNITTDAAINLGVSGNNNTRYTCNVTVEKCTFTGTGQTKVAVKSYTGGDKNLTITNCNVDNTMHSLAQVAGVENVTITNTVVKSKNGINVNSSTGNIVINECEIDVTGYAFRTGVANNNAHVAPKISITESTLKSAEEMAVEIRANVAEGIDLTMTRNVVVVAEGQPHITGTAAKSKVNADANYWGEGLTGPVVAEGSAPVVVNSYYSDADREHLIVTALTLQQFVEKVAEGNGTYNGTFTEGGVEKNITVKVVPVSGDAGTTEDVRVPNRLQKYTNPDVYYAQYQRFGELTDVNISNVNFVFYPAAVTVTDDWNTAGATTTADNINGELQLMNTGVVSFADCSFEKMSVSPISAATLSVTSSTFNGLDAYAIKDINATTATITGTTFTDCNGGFWFNNAPTTLTVTGNTFTGTGRRGAIQFSANGDYANTAMNVTGNNVTDNAAFLWQLNSTISNAQLTAILDKNNNTYTTAFVTGSVELHLQGEGTADNPYLINDISDLEFFRYDVNAGNNYAGKYVKLAANINLEGENWTPIGDITYNKQYQPADASKVFSGTFDGDNKVISNLAIEKIIGDGTNPDEDANVGFFGITGEGAVIKNLTFTHVNIKTSGRNVGTLAGFAYKTTLDNITVNGNIQIKGGNNVSGVVSMSRYYDMSATNIKVEGNDGSAIVGNNIVGGIFAEIAPDVSTQTFKNLSIENVAINGVGGVGGIVGLLTLGTVENVSVKDVALTGKTEFNGDAMGRIRLGSVAGLLGNNYATIANATTENVTAKNLDGNTVVLPIIGANYSGNIGNATEAKIGDTYYATLQIAINAAKAGDNTIQLLADITGDVTILQKEGINIVIDGKKAENENYTFNGTINIYGDARISGEETLTIQNINFYTEDNARYFIHAYDNGQIEGTNNYKQYAHNVTVENCKFATSAVNKHNTIVGMRFRQANDMSAVNCTSDGIFSIMWTTAVDGLKLNGVEATNCTEGITIGGASKKVNIIGTTIESDTYAIRAEGAGSDFIIENSTLVAKVPVVVRNVTENSMISFTFNGTNTITESNPTNYWFVAGETEYIGASEVMPTAPKGQVNVTLNDTGLRYEDVYGNYYELAGEGTADNPYTIANLYELKFFRNQVNAGNSYAGKYVKLTDDIDLAEGQNRSTVSNWEPISTFNGVFDGNDKTIYNLVVNGEGKNNQGFFGQTNNGEIKNLTINNAKVTGRQNVGVVAGTPYTSKYTNIKVTGHVEVNGMSYVGGVGGKNAYANWTGITVDVDGESYVKATSTENSTAYRTYVGGVIGFNSEGGHTFKNIASNINVIGDVCDIGGIFGIVHYDNKVEYVSCSAIVKSIGEADELGGIAGVWHNEKGTSVTMNNVTFTGKVYDVNGEVEGVDIVGGAYNANNETADNSGSLIIDGNEAWLKVAQIDGAKYLTLAAAAAAAQANETITLLADVTENVTLPSDITFNGNGKSVSGTITAGGNLTFIGVTTVDAFSAGYYNHTINIGEGASLEVTTNRLTVSYGNVFNITGSIEDAKTADKSNITPSLILTAGVSFNGDGQGVKFNVNNAYVVIGDATTKNSGATGEFNLNFDNSIVDFTKTLKTYEPTESGLNPVVNINMTNNSVVSFASHLELWRSATNFTLDNSNLTVGGSFANAGIVTVKNEANFVVNAPIMSSHGGNTGTIVADGGIFELKDSNQDWENAGTMKVTATGKFITNDFKCVGEGKMIVDAATLENFATAIVIDGNGVYNFEGVTTLENANGVTASYENGDVTITRTYVAKIGDTYYATLAEAATAAENGQTIELLWQEGQAPIFMKATFAGNKTVTITGTAEVIWDNGTNEDKWFYVGRNGVGDAKVIFDYAQLTSKSNSMSYGFNISQRKKESANTYNGEIEIKNSTIEVDYMINRNIVTLDNSTLTVKNYIGVAGRKASETENNEDGTATLTLSNGSMIITNNISGDALGGIGFDGIGIMNIDGTSTLVANKSFDVKANGTMNVAAESNVEVTGNLNVNGTLNSAGNITGVITKAEAATIILTGGTYTQDVNEWCHEYYDAIDNNDGTWTVKQVIYEQTREFATPGWYWFSTYINLEGEDGLNTLKKAFDGKASQIKGQEGFTDYYNVGGGAWTPGLSSISAADMYMIKTKSPVTINLTGDFVEYEQFEIDLKEGWNWLGFPLSKEVNINDAFATMDLQDGDEIKGKNNDEPTSRYYIDFDLGGGETYTGWDPTFNMKPGHGYMFKSVNEKSFRYSSNSTRSSDSGLKTINYNGDNHWFADAAQYPNNMSIVAMLSIDGEIVKDNYEVAAFAKGECRGSARPYYVEALDSYVLYMTIHGENVENLTFKYYDVNYGTEYEISNTIVYSNNASIGSLREPYMFNLGILNIDESSVENISIYPNPTTTGKEINLQAVCDKVEVFNALGVKVAEYTNVDSIDAIETAGIYVIRVTIDGNARNCRLIVK